MRNVIKGVVFYLKRMEQPFCKEGIRLSALTCLSSVGVGRNGDGCHSVLSVLLWAGINQERVNVVSNSGPSL